MTERIPAPSEETLTEDEVTRARQVAEAGRNDPLTWVRVLSRWALHLESALAEAKGQLVSTAHYEGNGEAGDGSVVCDGCAEPIDEESPHTATECLRISRDREAALLGEVGRKDERIAELETALSNCLKHELTRMEELLADADKAGNCYGSPVLTLLQLIEMVELSQRGKRKKLFRVEVARSALELLEARSAKHELRAIAAEKRIAELEAQLAAKDKQFADLVSAADLALGLDEAKGGDDV